ncbi:MAG: hypothetical protein PVI06_11560 [Desulfobacterales bacterium]
MMGFKKFSTVVLVWITCYSLVYGDIIPPSSHHVVRVVRLANVDAFPEVAFIGDVIQFDPNNKETHNRYCAYEIKPGQTLHMCAAPYSLFGKFAVYAVDKPYIENKGVDNIVFASDPQVVALAKDTEIIAPQGYYIDNKNPLIKEEIMYTAAGFHENKLIVYKLKH